MLEDDPKFRGRRPHHKSKPVEQPPKSNFIIRDKKSLSYMDNQNTNGERVIVYKCRRFTLLNRTSENGLQYVSQYIAIKSPGPDIGQRLRHGLLYIQYI